MRLWSIHPKYLDPKGLVALWREGLLAQKVLSGGTRGYKHHPQLQRFRELGDPMSAIGSYLWAVAYEARERGYAFDTGRIVLLPGVTLQGAAPAMPAIPVTVGQLAYEFDWLKQKVGARSPQHLARLLDIAYPEPHPSFVPGVGGIEAWERVPAVET